MLVSKQGMYHSQYLYGDVIQPSSFGVSLARKRVYLLADQKIYSLSIEE
ncbi:MAG: hypothetical protein N3A54_04415 [Patescibacteria group bacterium]|nr:hypothetical protein [Patescibacteria group bacterium]